MKKLYPGRLIYCKSCGEDTFREEGETLLCNECGRDVTLDWPVTEIEDDPVREQLSSMEEEPSLFGYAVVILILSIGLILTLCYIIRS